MSRVLDGTYIAAFSAVTPLIHRSRAGLAILLPFTAACGGIELESHGERYEVATRALIASNGVSVNGTSENGQDVNGIRVNGIRVNGIRVNGIRVNGIRINGALLFGLSITVQGSRLVAYDENGLEVALGSPFEVPATLEDGSIVWLRLEGPTPLDSGPNADVFVYETSYRDDATGAWHPIDEHTSEAIPLLGRWDAGVGVPGGGDYIDDPEVITLGVRGYALAKCIEMGYKPWSVAPDGRGLRDYHQACTRMIRADYCGDGASWTIDGSIVNVWDDQDIQVRENRPPPDASGWSREAEWDPSGAVCIRNVRIPDLLSDPARDASCVHALMNDPSCGSRFDGSSLIMTEFPMHRRRQPR